MFCQARHIVLVDQIRGQDLRLVPILVSLLCSGAPVSRCASTFRDIPLPFSSHTFYSPFSDILYPKGSTTLRGCRLREAEDKIFLDAASQPVGPAMQKFDHPPSSLGRC